MRRWREGVSTQRDAEIYGHHEREPVPVAFVDVRAAVNSSFHRRRLAALGHEVQGVGVEGPGALGRGALRLAWCGHGAVSWLCLAWCRAGGCPRVGGRSLRTGCRVARVALCVARVCCYCKRCDSLRWTRLVALGNQHRPSAPVSSRDGSGRVPRRMMRVRISAIASTPCARRRRAVERARRAVGASAAPKRIDTRPFRQ